MIGLLNSLLSKLKIRLSKTEGKSSLENLTAQEEKTESALQESKSGETVLKPNIVEVKVPFYQKPQEIIDGATGYYTESNNSQSLSVGSTVTVSRNLQVSPSLISNYSKIENPFFSSNDKESEEKLLKDFESLAKVKEASDITNMKVKVCATIYEVSSDDLDRGDIVFVLDKKMFFSNFNGSYFEVSDINEKVLKSVAEKQYKEQERKTENKIEAARKAIEDFSQES